MKLIGCTKSPSLPPSSVPPPALCTIPLVPQSESVFGEDCKRRINLFIIYKKPLAYNTSLWSFTVHTINTYIQRHYSIQIFKQIFSATGSYICHTYDMNEQACRLSQYFNRRIWYDAVQAHSILATAAIYISVFLFNRDIFHQGPRFWT